MERERGEGEEGGVEREEVEEGEEKGKGGREGGRKKITA